MGGRRTFSNYGSNIFPRPNDDIDPKLKDAQWHKNWCEYIFAYGSREDNNTPYSRQDQIQQNRLYADARQNEDQYLKRFEDEIGSGGQPVSQTDGTSATDTFEGRSRLREGYLNVNPEILPIFPKYLSLLIGKYSGIDHDITAEAQDLKSGAERQNLKWDTWFEAKQRPFLDNYHESISGEQPVTPAYLPESVEEMEMFENLGGFKLKHEIAIEILIGHSLDISEWEGTVKRKLIEDGVVNNIMAVQDYLDIHTNKVKTRYLDIANLIIPYNTENEYQNPEFHGYIRLYRAAELRLHDIPEERLKTYAKNFSGYYGNSRWDSVETYNSNNQGSSNSAYDDFLIPVMEAEWESVDTYFDQYRAIKSGGKLIKEEYYDVGKKKYVSGKYKNREDKKVERTNLKNRYQCKWILDSQDVFSYGKIYDTPRADNDVRSSVHAYQLNGRSILERCKPNLDEIQIEWLKFQNAVAIAAPPGVAVEYDALTNISTGDGTDFHPLDLLKLRSQTGNIIYKFTSMGFGGEFGRSNAGKPFEELAGGMGNALDEFNKSMQIQVGLIQQNTGIGSSADASNPDPNQSVKGSELAIVATSNTLKPLYDGYIYLKAKAADNMSYKIQLLLNDNPKVYEAYYRILGKAKLKTLKIAGKISASQFGIDVEARATDQMKADIKQQIQIGMQVGKNGNSSISPSQGLMLINMLENGQSYKLIVAMLEYNESRERERVAQAAEDNIEQQGEQKRLSDQQASEIKAKELADMSQMKKDEVTHLEVQKRETNRLIHLGKMEELELAEKIRLNNSPITNPT